MDLAGVLFPRSGDAVKSDLRSGCDNKKELWKRALQNTLSSIYIVPDNWTNPNCMGVIVLRWDNGSQPGIGGIEGVLVSMPLSVIDIIVG